MNQKLTLSMDREAIEKGKRFAAENGTSLSSLIETFLLLLDGDNQLQDSVPVSRNLQSLAGIAAGEYDEQDYREHIEDKHA